MRGCATFAEVLDQTLGAVPPSTLKPTSHPGARQAPTSPFLFSRRQFHFGSTPYGAAFRLRPRPARSLTARQQGALDALVGLGAQLRPDFTARELRTMFRRLAWRYHPDGHPGSSEEEDVSLSRRFAALTAHYRVLLAVVDSASA